MSLKRIHESLPTLPDFEAVRSWVERPAAAGETLRVRGAAGSLAAFLIAHATRGGGPVLCLTAEHEESVYLASDLEQVLHDLEERPVLHFPPTGRKPYDTDQIADAGPVIARADTLQQLQQAFRGFLVASVEAAVERTPPPGAIEQETLTIETGQSVPSESLLELLVGQGFERVEFVEQPGELALRGGILDVFPFTGDYPVRLEFFGDEIDSIREFDPRSQRSVSRLLSARLVPNLEAPSHDEGAHATLFDYLPAGALLVLFDEARMPAKAEECFRQAVSHYRERLEQQPSVAVPPPEALYLDGEALRERLSSHRRLLLGSFTEKQADLHLDARPQPSFKSNIGLLKRRIAENGAKGIQTLILCDSRGQETRLRELLEQEPPLPFTLHVESLHQGFEAPPARLAVYTDHEIFNRYHRPTHRRRQKKYGGLSLRELRNLTPGDFVVHVDYGVGKFAGLEKITVLGKQQEAVRVLFRDEDVLYVNVNALHKLHRYTGKEGHQPRLTKLGTGEWERTKARTKKRVKDIARDLIRLYAERKESKGFAFSADTIWQRELEASFQYEDTPDQGAAAEIVKQDMQEPIPMDRLVCGDVGFGKTEVAVRAAFKAVQDGKQVAVLVPTTILAAQHHETFTKRLASYPVRIETLSRFRTPKEQKEVIERVARGDVDILIGTQRLVSKDVRFKDLGLLIVDEEQRFGVTVKEKLRKMRVDVDTLTLTATPIPRTLQFSLLGARDLSIINTPPPNRQPIVTEIHTFDRNLIRDAILYEISRGGQVFFIHNRVQSIEEIAFMLRALVPDVRMRVGHGQMKPTDLEHVMLDFMEKRFDVLVSTNIIESGLDVPNANTILINHAERFGLADLHQLRGRVGRSDRKAFCYLLVPSIHTLTPEARQRLQAVEEFSELGSGFSIAMRDLDIRGAGSLLGAEQSGFIEEVGYETYHRILDEAVQELRTEEFSHVFNTTAVPAPGETTMDVEEDAFLPQDYVSNGVERLNLYRRLSEADDAGAIRAIGEEMSDRFGPLPQPAENLLRGAEIKLLAQSLRLPRVQFKNERLFLDLPPQQDGFFYEQLFHPLLERLNQLGRRFVLKDAKHKLRVIVQDVPDLDAARQVLARLAAATMETAEKA